MPDVSMSGIEFTIKGSSDAASASVQNLTKQLDKLGASLSRVRGVKDLSKSMRGIGGSAKAAAKRSNEFLGSIMRIAKYRLIRSALKAVTQAFTEGLKNAYQFSKINDGALAKSLDTIATKGMTMKNQLGAAFGGLITAIAPIVYELITLITRLATALSMLFAAFGGSTQFKAAKDAWTDWGEAAGGAGGAAKEALKYLAPFDELNVLPEDKGGGGGGGSMPDIEDMFEYQDLPEWLQNFAERLGELTASLKITFKDVFFDWSDLTGEQIAEKAIAGIGGLLGAAVGFMLGGVPGAVTGTLVGVSISVLLSSLIFDHDGVISAAETASMLKTALNGLVGGVIGFVLGGPGGALLGVSIALGVTTLVKALKALSGEKLNGVLDDIVDALNLGIGGGLGASAGFVVGGPMGAAVGLTLGLGISMILSGVTFDPVKGETKEAIEQYLQDLDEAFKDAKPGTYQQQYYQHFHDYAVREMEGSGSDAGDSFLTKFKDKWDEILGGKTFGEWLLEGIGDIADNIALIFTGMTWSDLDQWLSDGGELLKGWLEDLPAKFKNAGITAANGLITALAGGLNKFVDEHPNIAAALGLEHIDIDMLLIPQIPEEELTKNYDEAKAAIEARSKEQPAYMTWEIAENPESFSIEDLIGKPSVEVPVSFIPDPDPNPESFSIEDLLGDSATISVTAEVDQVTTKQGFKPIFASIAEFEDYMKNSDGSAKTGFETPFMNVYAWPEKTYYKSDGSLSGDFKTPWMNVYAWAQKTYTTSSGALSTEFGTPWMNVMAWVYAYSIAAAIADAAGRIKLNANAIITALTNQTGGGKALGGVFSHGAWSNIPQYAGGTTKAHGSLFVAGEAGPEVVGHIGGRTEVLNRSQLAATMYSAVNAAMRGVSYDISAPTISTTDESTNEDVLYRAFMRAIADSDLDKEINLDGEPIYRAVVRRNRQNTRATGVNQLAMA